MQRLLENFFPSTPQKDNCFLLADKQNKRDRRYPAIVLASELGRGENASVSKGVRINPQTRGGINIQMLLGLLPSTAEGQRVLLQNKPNRIPLLAK